MKVNSKIAVCQANDIIKTYHGIYFGNLFNLLIENCACFLSTQNIYIATSVYYTLAVLFTLESGHLLFPFKQ